MSALVTCEVVFTVQVCHMFIARLIEVLVPCSLWEIVFNDLHPVLSLDLNSLCLFQRALLGWHLHEFATPLLVCLDTLVSNLF